MALPAPRKSATALMCALAVTLGVTAAGMSGVSSAQGSDRAVQQSKAGTSYVNQALTETVLWSEDFDSVPTPTDFTHTLPKGWSKENSGFTTGEARWAGWAVTNIRDWTWAVGTDKRHYFTRAHDKLAVVESQHQRLNDTDRLNTALKSPAIDVKKHDRIVLGFDSHYRQGAAPQHATVSVSFDGGKPVELRRYDADKLSSHEAIALDVPKGARKAVFTWSYKDGHNDWFWAIDNARVSLPMGEAEGGPAAVIDVISDIQGGIANYKSAVTQLNAMPDPAGAMFVNGDFVDLGKQELYDEFEAATKDVPHASGRNYYTIGNHEMLGQEGSEAYINRFLDFTGQDKVWREEIVDGIPNITVNTEYYSDVDRKGVEPYVKLSDEQLRWLDSRLAHWAKQGKPVMLYNHQAVPYTVTETHSSWNGNDYFDLEAFTKVVGKYANIIMFTSHTHQSLQAEDWWGRLRTEATGNMRGIPVVNTGAIKNATEPYGDHESRRLQGNHSSGLRVKVFEDRVRVEAWDFVAEKKIKHVDFPVPAKRKG